MGPPETLPLALTTRQRCLQVERDITGETGRTSSSKQWRLRSPPCNPGSLSGVSSQTLCSWIPHNTPLMLQLNLYLFVFIISSNQWHLFLWWNAKRLVIKCNFAHRQGHISMCGCLYLYVPYMHMFESPAYTPCIYMCFCTHAYSCTWPCNACALLCLSHPSSHLTAILQSNLPGQHAACQPWTVKKQNQNESFIILENSNCHALMNWLHTCDYRLID